MARFFAARFWRDARHYQIAALSTLVVFNLGWIDFGARPANTALALAASLLTQIVCSRLTGVPIDLRSPLITGLSLSLLLRTEEPLIHALAGVIAHRVEIRAAHRRQAHLESGRLRHRGAAVRDAGPRLDLARKLGLAGVVRGAARFFAILVLGAARRSDIAIFFIGTHAALLFARALWLGDPFAIPLHQLQSGSLLIFTFFMISDPRTSPDSRLGRFIFAASVARAAHYMAFFMQMRPALYVALIALSPVHFPDRQDPAGGTLLVEPPATQGALPMKVSRLKSTVAVAAILAQLAAQTGPAAAFCGFYVAKADAKLFNKSSKVVLTRDGETTAITMASDYEGSRRNSRWSSRCRPSSSASRSAWST